MDNGTIAPHEEILLKVPYFIWKVTDFTNNRIGRDRAIEWTWETNPEGCIILSMPLTFAGGAIDKIFEPQKLNTIQRILCAIYTHYNSKITKNEHWQATSIIAKANIDTDAEEQKHILQADYAMNNIDTAVVQPAKYYKYLVNKLWFHKLLRIGPSYYKVVLYD